VTVQNVEGLKLLKVDTKVSGRHEASLFRTNIENEASIFLQNASIHFKKFHGVTTQNIKI
jgi:hypothetical protein